MSERKRRQRIHDETLICERCGVTFLWLAEEKKVHGPEKAPVHCPGCQSLMPTGERERGLVKWYNPRKRYGFIIRQKDTDIFTHRSGFEAIGRLQEGDLVEFSVTTGDKGLLATNVRLLRREAPEEQGE